MEECRMYHYVLFDLDGTLTDPKEGICKSVQYALCAQGIEEPDLNKLEPFIGPPLKKSFQEFYGMDEAAANTAVAKYRERFEKTGLYENEIYPGMKEFLVSLRKKGVHLAVASSKPQEFVERILKHFEIRQYFQVVTGSEKDGRRSEKKEVIEETLLRLFHEKKVPAGDVLMVGDRKFDVEGARDLGLKCAGVSYGYGAEGELEEAGAAYVTDNLGELFYIITGEKMTDAGTKISGWQKSVRILSPIVYDLALSFLILFFFQAAGRIFLGNIFRQYSTPAADSRRIAVYLDGISALICAAVFAKMYNREKVRPISHVVKRRNDERLLRNLAPLIGFSVSAALFLNILIARLGLTGASGAYREAADMQYSVPVILGLINYGILQPLEEELVFRGLVYGRMRKYFPAGLSIPFSSLVFGACHGNIVQMMYGFFMGCILAWAFEKYKTLKAPLVLHGGVNAVIYLISTTETLSPIFSDRRSMAVTAVLTAAFCSFFVRESVWKMKK